VAFGRSGGMHLSSCVDKSVWMHERPCKAAHIQSHVTAAASLLATNAAASLLATYAAASLLASTPALLALNERTP
jgi:hypothetical protein